MNGPVTLVESDLIHVRPLPDNFCLDQMMENRAARAWLRDELT